jgi:hypothetical protein
MGDEDIIESGILPASVRNQLREAIVRAMDGDDSDDVLAEIVAVWAVEVLRRHSG